MPERAIDLSWFHHLKLFNCAIQAFQNHRYSQAIIKIKQAIWIDCKNSDAYYFLFLCHARHNPTETKYNNLLESAKKMNPLCEIYNLPHNKAIKMIKQIVQKSIQYEKAILQQNHNLIINNWYNYSVMLHESTNFHRVELVYQRLFSRYPQLYTTKSHAFLGNYANVLYDLGKYDEALRLYEIQIGLDPNELRYFSNCAMLYTITGKYNKAEQYIKKALEGSPERTSFIFNYANILAKTKRFELSLQSIKKVIGRQPSDPIFRLKFVLTMLMWDLQQHHIQLSKQSLRKCAFTFQQCLKKNNINLVNCQKRILSMNNVEYLYLFASKIGELLQQQLYSWKYFQTIVSIISDYLIVGQSTKLQLNDKLLMIMNETISSAASDNLFVEEKEVQEKQKQQKIEEEKLEKKIYNESGNGNGYMQAESGNGGRHAESECMGEGGKRQRLILISKEWSQKLKKGSTSNGG